MVSRPSKTRAVREDEVGDGEGKVVLYVQFASLTLFLGGLISHNYTLGMEGNWGWDSGEMARGQTIVFLAHYSQCMDL